jgi:hypothetical protein
MLRIGIFIILANKPDHEKSEGNENMGQKNFAIQREILNAVGRFHREKGERNEKICKNLCDTLRENPYVFEKEVRSALEVRQGPSKAGRYAGAAPYKNLCALGDLCGEALAPT